MSIRNRNAHIARVALGLLTGLALAACQDDRCDLATIQGRLDASAAGETVTIPASCRLEGSLVVPAGVTLAGEADAELAVTDPSAIGVELGSGARVESLRVEAGGRAALVARGDASIAAVEVDLRHGLGLYLVGGTVDASGVVLTGPVTAANADDSTWVNVLPEPSATGCTAATCDCAPGTIVSDTEICDSRGEVVTWAPTIGIYTREATLSLTNVSVAGIARYGVVADDASTTWSGGEVRDVVGVGLLLRGGSSDLADVTVRRTVSGLRGVPSYGVLTAEGHEQVTSGVTVLDGERFGLVSLDGRGDHGDLSIRDNGDVGLWVSASDAFSVSGTSAVESNGLAGVVVIDSTGVVLDGLRVADTTSVTRSVGTFGMQTIGDGVQLVGANEALLRDVAIVGNARVGLLADVVPALTFADVEVSSSGSAFGALGGTASMASGEIVVDTGLAWDTGIVRMGAAVTNDPAASGAFDALVEGRPDGADSVVGIVGPMY